MFLMFWTSDHLSIVKQIPRDEEGEPLYEDFICQGCAVACSFLTCYPQIFSTSNPSDSMKEKAVETSKVYDGNGSTEPTSSYTAPVEADAETVTKECSDEAGPSTKCIIGDIIESLPATENAKPLFLSKGWREFLCRCGKCLDFYAQRRIGFMLDKEDSIAEYEKMGEQKRNENIEKQEGAELNFLNNLGHVEKMEILSGIADMKNEIFTFLVCWELICFESFEVFVNWKSFMFKFPLQESSDPSKAITTADIQQVFENLAKKRKRND